jgi:osmotically-inducible protein OsmY
MMPARADRSQRVGDLGLGNLFEYRTVLVDLTMFSGRSMSQARRYMSDDDAIERALRAALEHGPALELRAGRLSVEYADGNTILRGEVDSIPTKKRALEIAAAVPNVGCVVDRLRIKPPATMGDGEIADHLEFSLLDEPAFNGCGLRRRRGPRIEIVRPDADDVPAPWTAFGVDRGVITLNGELPSLAHKRLAGILAWWIPGCCDVINDIGVVSEDLDTDQEILRAYRLILEKDPLVSAYLVQTSCEGAVITLRGTVYSAVARRAAEFDAWALFGVEEVINDLQVATD